ncbi:DUF4920 domain-containing protein [Flavobacteriaceae bacterium M23B6Z8]
MISRKTFRAGLLFCLVCSFAFLACNAQQKKESYQDFGTDFELKTVATTQKMSQKYEALPAGDSLEITLKAKVNAVCKAKGCWMRLDMDGEEVMVKFKDYGFFVPKDIEGKEVIVNGKAFVNVVSVEEQQHYAKDAGKSEQEIAAITQPKKTYSFEASGVKIKE